MKKLLLSFAAACAVTAASAAVADLTKVWEKPVENAYKSTAKAWNAPVAVDAAGNVIATGAFTEDLKIAGATLEAVGTSAYVVKYDKAGTAAWAVAFTGAATSTAIDTDADGNIYIASEDIEACRAARTTIENIVFEPVVGQLYYGKVVRIIPIGAFVELVPGKDGMVHIKDLEFKRTEKVEDVLNIGDYTWVKVTEIDDRGRVNLSRKDAIREREQQGLK